MEAVRVGQGKPLHTSTRSARFHRPDDKDLHCFSSLPKPQKMSLPKTYKAAQISEKGGKFEIVERELKEPQQGAFPTLLHGKTMMPRSSLRGLPCCTFCRLVSHG